jgi:hypothetical protein
MTKEQLELLLKYIDLRVQRAADLPEGINFGYSDEEVDIRQDLRNTIRDKEEEIKQAIWRRK